MAFTLVAPAREHLPGYRDALLRGWSPDTLRPAAATDLLARLDIDADGLLATLNGAGSGAETVTLPDGSTVPRLPGFVRWIVDNGFAGQIGLRWQPGTDALPPTCPGHVGYTVVPWRRRRGLATRALAALLPLAADVGLTTLEITCDPDNLPSRRVIETNGGRLVERFRVPPALGGTEHLRFRIDLHRGA